MALSLAACGGSSSDSAETVAKVDYDAAVAARDAAIAARDLAVAAQAEAEAAEAAAVLAQGEAEDNTAAAEAARDAAVAARATAETLQALAETAEQEASDALAAVNAQVTGAGFASVDALIAAYDALANPTTVSAVATTAADALSGTAGNDTFTAYMQYTAGGVVPTTNATLNAADVFTGGEGTDTLILTIDGSPNAAVTLPTFTASSVETVSIRNVSGQQATLDVANVGGLQTVVSNMSTNNLVVNNIGTADVTIVGNDVVTNGNFSFSSGASSQTDALVINVQGGVGAGAITSTSANDDWTSVTINSTGGTATATTNANVTGALDLAGGNTMQALTVNASSSFTAASIVGWDTTGASTANKGLITVTGAGAVNLGSLDAAVEDVTASANSGGVTATLSTQTDFTFIGSTGNDVITTAAVLSTSSAAPGSVDAGAGTADRVVVANSTHITATVGAKYTNFEQLQVQNGVSVDMDHVSGIDTVRINQGGNATGVTDMSAAQAAAVTIVGTGAGAVTLGVKGATAIGQVDTVTLNINDGAAAAADLVLTAPVLTGVENLVINAASDAVSISALTSATSLTSIDINATHASTVTTDVTSGAVAFGANTSINASDSTVGVNIDISAIVAATGSSAVAITGGAGNDTLTTSGANADTVAGGAGIDTIVITQEAALAEIVTVISTATSTADADEITGFETAEDLFDYNGVLSNGAGAAPTIAATEVASGATIAAALATADAANDIVFIATTDLTGAQETAMDAFIGGQSAATASAVVDAIIGTGGALNGAIANLDSVLGASDAVLFQFSTDSDTFVFRVTNTTNDGNNVLTSGEVELVAGFVGATDLVAADYVA